MLVNLQIQSVFTNYFNGQSSLKVDLYKYADLFQYLRSMHPRFFAFIKRIDEGKEEDAFVFLDSNKNIIDPNTMFYRTAKEDDIIYICPAIIGGGGKKGLFAALIGVAVLGIFTGGFGLLAAGAAEGAVGGAAAEAIAAEAVFSGGAGIGLSGVSGFLKTIALNVGLSLLTAAFQPRPKSGNTEETRENDIFSSLTNTTASGTPIPLSYGLVRIAGQLLTGFIHTETHGKEEAINVGDKFFGAFSVNPLAKGAKGSEFISKVSTR